MSRRAATSTVHSATRARVVVSSAARGRIQAARDFVGALPPATEAVLVGATRAAVDDLAIAIAANAGATFGLHRLSFTRLVSTLASAELARAGLAPATALGAEAVAARAAFEARLGGQIGRFETVSHYPGFARSLARTLGELRTSEIDTPSRSAARGGEELGRILALYETELEQATIADRATQLRLATQALQSGEWALKSAPVVLLDVAVASVLERRFLEALCGAAGNLLATIPAGDEATLAAWSELGVTPDLPDEVPGADATALARLQAHLFSDDEPPASDVDQSVTFSSAPGEGRECIEIARQILDAARAGTRFDAIAVFLRAPEVYSPLLEAAFRRAQIPAYFAHGTRRPDPSGRALLALLSCRSEGLSARRFAEYLSFAQVPLLDESGAPPPAAEPGTQLALDLWVGPSDEALAQAAAAVADSEAAQPRVGDSDYGDDPDSPAEAADDSDDRPTLSGALRTPWKWEALLVEAAVIRGRQRWRRRLSGLDNEMRLRIAELADDDPESPRLKSLERDLVNIGHLERFAWPVIEALDDLPDSATWGEWLAALGQLAPRVLKRPERVLAVLAELEPMATVGPVTIGEVREVLSDRLSTLERQRPTTRYGRVYVATAEQARGRSFDVVFVPGLAERVFPQRPREDPLLADDVRRMIDAALPLQNDRVQHERLLLRLIAGAAGSHIHLSYPRVDVAEARPRVPSFYALDIARATRGEIPDIEVLERDAAAVAEARLAWPAPTDPDRAIDAVEHDLAVLGPLLHDAGPDEARGRARYLLGLSPYLTESLRKRWQRWRRSWTPADGIVRSTASTGPLLDSQSLKERSYSVTALQKFATCPYQFLLSAIYRLHPREEAVALVQLDPLTRGSMYHEVQAEVMRALGKQGKLPITNETVDAAQRVLDVTLDDVATRYYEQLAPAIDRVWQDEVEVMRSDLRVWLRYVARDAAEWQPAYFELGFGLPPDPSRDAASLTAAAVLEDGTMLRGVVDLVERRPDGRALRVTDHKTGKDRLWDGLVVGKGEALQPVLYSLALERALGVEVSEGRLFFCTARAGFSERRVPIDERARLYAGDTLRIIDSAVQAGRLPPAPREGACRWCDFRPVCGPWEETRSKQKEPKFLEELKELRQYP